jgi:hypothetical protein
MRHPRNAGLAVYRDEIVGQATWEPIVPEEEWRAILARSEAMPKATGSNASGNRVKSLLGGIAECEQCGERVKRTRQQSKRKTGETVFTYIYQPRCHHVSINAEWLDQHVAKFALRQATHPIRGLMDGRPVDSDEAQQAAAEAVKLRERLEDVARREARDDLTRQQADAQSAILRERLAAAEAKAISFYSASPLDRAYSPAQVVGAWKSGEMSLQYKREAVAKYVRSIKIRPRKNRNEKASAAMVTIEGTFQG